MSIEGDISQKQARILVIDDEEVVHASLKKIILRAGHEMESVFRAKDGLECLKEKDFDLAIVDLMMPEMNGLEFLEVLRASDSWLPVLMVTGYPTITTAVRALRLGAVDYVSKPFTRKELLSPVQRALSLSEEETIFESDIGDEIILKDNLVPGTVCVLHYHAWAKFEQDGTFLVGVEKSFLRIFNEVLSVSVPEELDLVEQGYVGFHLTNENEEEHGVAMPLSGQVVAVNEEVLVAPGLMDHDTWIIRIIPSHLDEELKRLVSLKDSPKNLG